MNNISLTTVQLIPYRAQRKAEQELRMLDAEWVRETVNMLYNRKKEAFIKAGVLTDLFHNHDEKSQQTIVRYPLIQYHANEEGLFAVGINEGGEALRYMTSLNENLIYLTSNMSVKIEIVEQKQHEVCETPHLCRYQLKDYIPFSTDAYKEFSALAYLKEKTDYIAAKIENHILKDFAKYLSLTLNEAKVEIVDISSFHRPKVGVQVNKHRHDFQPFDLILDVAVDLPSGICLGNGKTYGYGLLDRIS